VSGLPPGAAPPPTPSSGPGPSPMPPPGGGMTQLPAAAPMGVAQGGPSLSGGAGCLAADWR
jgi:hypothetical protein